MGQVIQTNGDYSIKARTNVQGLSPTIRLDPGTDGKVLISGDLVISGSSTEVSVEDLSVVDNIVVVNKGEQSAGVTLNYAGLKVDRGTELNVAVLWDELADSWGLLTSTASETDENFEYSSLSRLTLRELRTDPETNNGDLFINVGQNGVISLPVDNEYYLKVVEPYHIPNKEYVDDAIQNQPTIQLRSDNSRVFVVDRDNPISLTTYNSIETSGGGNFQFPADENAGVVVIVDNVISSEFFQDSATIRGLEFKDLIGVDSSYQGTVITTKETVGNTNVFVQTRGSGKLQTNVGIQLDNIPSTPTPAESSTILHSKIPSVGTTGLYFVNNSASGELISKDKALVFSMLF